MSTAGKNLKYLRKLRGWTQEEFAAKLKIKRSLLGAYEEERAEPRIEVLEIVGDLFKLTLDDLLRKELSDTRGSYLAKRRAQKLVAASNDIQLGPGQGCCRLSGRICRPRIPGRTESPLRCPCSPPAPTALLRSWAISMLPTPSGSVIVGEKVRGSRRSKK